MRPDESVRLQEVARDPAFREAVTWQSREALASAVNKLASDERESQARRLSVGMKLTLTCVNVIVGFTAILLTLRTLRFRRASDPAAAADTS